MEKQRNSAAYREPLALEPRRESSISRLVIAPLTFISFLISLALIDSHNSSLRASSRSTPSSPGLFCKVRKFFHGIVFKKVDGRGPYAYVKSPDGDDGAGDVDDVGNRRDGVGKGKDGRKGKGKGNEKEGEWYYHSKQRQIMKAEFEDAFQMRNSIAVGIIAVILGVVYVVVGFASWVFG